MPNAIEFVAPISSSTLTPTPKVIDNRVSGLSAFLNTSAIYMQYILANQGRCDFCESHLGGRRKLSPKVCMSNYKEYSIHSVVIRLS